MSALRATAYTFATMLPSVATAGTYQLHPTLAAGDVKVSLDGGAFANLTTMPTVTTGSPLVYVTLSIAEMTATTVMVWFHDVAGAEWLDAMTLIQPELVSTLSIWTFLQQSTVKLATLRPRQDPARLRR